MTYDDYWNKDCLLTKYYRQAFDLKKKFKNQELWLQGLYIYEALCDVAPILNAFAKNGTKPTQYSKEPYPLTKEEAEEQEERRQQEEMKKAQVLFEAFSTKLNMTKKKEENNGDRRPSD